MHLLMFEDGDRGLGAAKLWNRGILDGRIAKRRLNEGIGSRAVVLNLLTLWPEIGR